MMTTAGMLAWCSLYCSISLRVGRLGHLASPIFDEHDAEPFRRFDVVLVNRWAFAGPSRRPGDVVLFRPAVEQRAVAEYASPRWSLDRRERVGRPGRRRAGRSRRLGRRPADGQRQNGPWAP